MANTATPNQPLIQHPLPFGMGRMIGAGATLVEGAAPNSDSLLVPAPASSPNGSVSRGLDTLASLMNNSGADVDAGAGNFSLVYKAEGSLEAIFGADANALADGATVQLQQAAPFLLAPTDRGIYLRLGDLQEDGGGGGDFPGTLDCYASYLDYRDFKRVAFDLTETFQTILEGVQGKARLLGRGGEDFGEFFAVVANFDTADRTVELRISDGTNTFLIPQASATAIPDGEMAVLDVPLLPALLEGWTLEARITDAVDDNPCRLILGYTDTNLSPVRTDQGGAF